MTASIAPNPQDRTTRTGRRLGICAYDSPDALLTTFEVWDEFGLSRRALVGLYDKGEGPNVARDVRDHDGELWYRRADVTDWCEHLGIPIRPRQRPTPSTGPVDCEPWCKYADGHPNVPFREDQRCYSEDLRVDLSHHLPIEESVYSEDSREWLPGPDHLTVFGVKAPGEAARLGITVHDDDEIHLTPAEARHLLEVLQLLLGQVRPVISA